MNSLENTIVKATTFLSPQAASVAKTLSVTEEKYTEKSNENKGNLLLFLFIFFIVLLLYVYIYYYAFKLACESGFSFMDFLLAYFFTIPYIIVKLIMKST